MNSLFLGPGNSTAGSLVDIAPIRSAQDIENAFVGVSDCIQLTPGAVSGFVSTISLGALTVHEYAIDRGVELRFGPDPNMITAGFIIEGERVIERGRPWTKHQVCVSSNSDVAISTLGPSHVVWIRLGLDRVAPRDRAGLESLSPEAFVDASMFSDVRRIVDILIKDPRVSETVVPRARLLYLRSELARTFVVSLRRVALATGSELAREHRSLNLVRSVEKYMWENVEEPLTLNRICKEMHCGVRALIYAFKDVYGIGPMTYWKVRRLNGAHRKLRESQGHTAILEIAADFGFWHMGHFSSDHKQMFGLTPSQTIESGIPHSDRALSMTS